MSINIVAVDGAGMLKRDPAIHDVLIKMVHDTIDEIDFLLSDAIGSEAKLQFYYWREGKEEFVQRTVHD